MPTVQVHQIFDSSNPDWLEMRGHLWPAARPGEHEADAARLVAEPSRFAVFLALSPDGRGVGFAEASVRHDYVNGCDTSRVAFLEGIYVRPERRRQGVARRLCQAVESWGRARGCQELASDALLDNAVSHLMHRALGFQETERVVYFKKHL